MTKPTTPKIFTPINGELASIHDLYCASANEERLLVQHAWSSLSGRDWLQAARWLNTAAAGGAADWHQQCAKLASWLCSENAGSLPPLRRAFLVHAELGGVHSSNGVIDDIRDLLGAAELSVVLSGDLLTAAFTDPQAKSAGLSLNRRASERIAESACNGQVLTLIYGHAVLAPVRDYGGFDVPPKQAAERLLDSLGKHSARALRVSATGNSANSDHQIARADCR